MPLKIMYLIYVGLYSVDKLVLVLTKRQDVNKEKF